MKLFDTFDINSEVRQDTQQGSMAIDGPIKQLSGRYQIVKGKGKNREVDGSDDVSKFFRSKNWEIIVHIETNGDACRKPSPSIGQESVAAIA